MYWVLVRLGFGSFDLRRRNRIALVMERYFGNARKAFDNICRELLNTRVYCDFREEKGGLWMEVMHLAALGCFACIKIEWPQPMQIPQQ